MLTTRSANRLPRNIPTQLLIFGLQTCYFTVEELSAHTEWAGNSDGCKTDENENNCWQSLIWCVGDKWPIANMSSCLTLVNTGNSSSGLRTQQSLSMHSNYGKLIRIKKSPKKLCVTLNRSSPLCVLLCMLRSPIVL